MSIHSHLTSRLLSFVLAFILFVGCTTTTVLASGNVTDFSNEVFSIRNGITYQMTESEIMKRETATFFEKQSGNRLSYKGTMEGFRDAQLWYTLDEENKLYELRYRLDMNSYNMKPDASYQKVYLSLLQKYGSPFYSFADGEFLPIRSSAVDYKIKNYSEWLIQYQDCYVVVDLVCTYSTIVSHYFVFLGYRMLNQEECSQIVDYLNTANP